MCQQIHKEQTEQTVKILKSEVIGFRANVRIKEELLKIAEEEGLKLSEYVYKVVAKELKARGISITELIQIV